ncbi:hypothetical protein TWF696_001480 [Orbilia brochopaga]|uniref:Polyprotein n=1 Tax=Orbilia brochopaga TaxID=3140254 RepID=A0AAV9UCC4_9PEZI
MPPITGNPNDAPINWNSHPASKVFRNEYLAAEILGYIDDPKTLFALLNINRAIRSGILNAGIHWERFQRIVVNREYLPTHYPPQHPALYDPDIEEHKQKMIETGEWPKKKFFDRFGDFAFEEFVVGKILRMPYWFAPSTDIVFWAEVNSRKQFITTLILDGTAVTGRGLFGSVAMPTCNDIYRTSAGLLSYVSATLEHLSLRYCPYVQHSDIAIFLLMPPSDWTPLARLKTLRVYGCGEAPTEGPFQNLPGFGSKNKITQKSDNILNIQILALLFPICLTIDHHKKYSVPLTVPRGRGSHQQLRIQQDRFDALRRAGWLSQTVLQIFPPPLTLPDPLNGEAIPGPFGGFLASMHESLMLRSICYYERIKLDWGFCALGSDCHSFKIENFTPVAKINHRSGRTTGVGHLYGALAGSNVRRQDYHSFTDGIVPRIPVALSNLIPGKGGLYIPHRVEEVKNVPWTGEGDGNRDRPKFLSLAGYRPAPDYYDPGATGELCKTVAGLSGEGIHIHCAVGAGRRKEKGGKPCANCGLWEYENYPYKSRQSGPEITVMNPGRDVIGELYFTALAAARAVRLVLRETLGLLSSRLQAFSSKHATSTVPRVHHATMQTGKPARPVGMVSALNAYKKLQTRIGVGVTSAQIGFARKNKFVEDHGVPMKKNRWKEASCQNCFERQLAWSKTELDRVETWKNVGVNILQREYAASKFAERVGYREWIRTKLPMSDFEKGLQDLGNQLPNGRGPRIVELGDADNSDDSSSEISEIDPENSGVNHPILKQMDKLYADLSKEITSGKVVPKGMTDIVYTIRAARYHIERSKVAELERKQRRKAAKGPPKRAKNVTVDNDPACGYSPATFYGRNRMYLGTWNDELEPLPGHKTQTEFNWVPRQDDKDFFDHRLNHPNSLYHVSDVDMYRLSMASEEIPAEKSYRKEFEKIHKPGERVWTWHQVYKPRGWEHRADGGKLKRKAEDELVEEVEISAEESQMDYSDYNTQDQSTAEKKTKKRGHSKKKGSKKRGGEQKKSADKGEKSEASAGETTEPAKKEGKSGGFLATKTRRMIKAEKERYVRRQLQRLDNAFNDMTINGVDARPGENVQVPANTQNGPLRTEAAQTETPQIETPQIKTPHVEATQAVSTEAGPSGTGPSEVKNTRIKPNERRKVHFADDPTSKPQEEDAMVETRKVASISSKWTKFAHDRAVHEEKTGMKPRPIGPLPPTKSALKKMKKEAKEAMKKPTIFQSETVLLLPGVRTRTHAIVAATAPFGPSGNVVAPAPPQSESMTAARGTAVRLGIAKGRAPIRTAAMIRDGVPREKHWDGFDEKIADDKERGYIA